MTRPDPWAAALSSFTPRPGAKVSIQRYEEELRDDVKYEWSEAPPRDQCPSFQRLSPAQYCYWALDWLGVPYRLTGDRGDPVVTSSPSNSILGALR